MNSKDLEIILKESEGYNIEFKRKADKSLSKELVAFSHSSGGKISLPRNPLFFDLFHRLGFIEKVGSGITRIKNVCKERNIQVKFDTEDFFIVAFYRKVSPRKTPLKEVSLTELEDKILKVVKENNKVTQSKIADKLDISIYTVKEYIKKLKEKKVLKRKGSPRGGWWEVLNE